MNEIEVLNLALLEYRQAEKIKANSLELYEQLRGSIFYLLKYCEKYNIQLPKKDELVRMLEKTNFLIEHTKTPYQPTVNTKNTSHEDNRTFSKICV